MAGAGRKIAVVQIVGLDAVLDQGSHQRGKRVRIVVHAAQQHALAQHRNARIDDASAGCACPGRQLARMVGVQH